MELQPDPETESTSERDLPPSPSPHALIFFYLSLQIAFAAAVFTTREDYPLLADFGRYSVCATILGALIYGIYRYRPTHIVPWLLLGASVLLWLLRGRLNAQGDSAWRLPLIFSSDLLAIIFFAMVIRYRNLVRDPLLWMDIAIITLSCSLLMLRYTTLAWWHLVDSDPIAAVRILALPLGHMLIVGGFIGVALTMRRPSPALLLILLAQAALLITEILRLDIDTLQNLQFPDVDLRWNAVVTCGLILYGIAALLPDMRRLSESADSVYRPWERAHVALIFFVICMGLTAVASGPWPLHEHVKSWAMVATAIVMQGVLLARCHIAIRAGHRVRHELLRSIEHDALTDLPNAHALQKNLMRQRSSASRYALGLLDINRFSEINHTWGHAAGDQVLKAIAKILREGLQRRVQLYRVDGDVFALLMPIHSVQQSYVLFRLARILLQKLRAPLQVQGQRFYLSANIGISQSADTIGAGVDTLLRDADSALFQAKQQGGNAIALFAPEMRSEITERHRIATALRQGMGTEFRLVYQPIVALANSVAASHEVLLRWNSATLGEVSPAVFIPIAEKAGLIRDITHWVITHAFLRLSQLPAEQRLSLNISAHDLRDPEFLPMLDRLSEAHNIEPARITLEFTEGAMVEDFEHIPPLLLERGYTIAIDDFGTGYSSLSYLMTLPASTVKLDISFIAEIEHDLNQRALCGSLIALCHENGLSVVAEGVETQAQHEILLGMSCDFAQGWLFGKPAPNPEASAK